MINACHILGINENVAFENLRQRLIYKNEIPVTEALEVTDTIAFENLRQHFENLRQHFENLRQRIFQNTYAGG